MKEVEIDENIKSIDEISAKKDQWKPIIHSVIQTMSTTFGNASTPNAVEGMDFGLKVMFQENVQTVKDELIKYNDYLLKEVNGKTNFQLFAEKKNPHEFYRMINRLNDHFGGVFNMEAIGKLAPESKKVIDAEVSKRVKHDKYYDTYYKKSFAENKSLYRSFIPTKYRSENLERQKLGAISFGRTGGHTITTLMLLAKKDSKGNHLYTIDEVFDEKKLVAEKHQIFEEVINHSIKAGTSIKAAESNSPDANWLVDTMFDIIMDANKRINELAEKIDTTKDDFIYSEEFIKVCELSSTVFDVWQEIWRYNKACEAKLEKEFPNIKDKGDRYEHFSTMNGPFSLMNSDIYMVLTNVRKYHDQNGEVNYGGMFTSGIRLAVAKQMILDWKKNGKGMPATVYMNSVNADKLYTQVSNDSGKYGGALYEKVNSKNEEITINRLMDGSLFKNVRYIPVKGNKKAHFENLPTYNSKKGDYDIPGVNTGNIIKDETVVKKNTEDKEKIVNILDNDDNIIHVDNHEINADNKPPVEEINTDAKPPVEEIKSEDLPQPEEVKESEKVEQESLSFDPEIIDNASFNINLNDAEDYVQALKGLAGNARGFIDSDEYTLFYNSIDDVADEIRKLKRNAKTDTIKNKEEDKYADYKKSVRRLLRFAKAYEDYKLSDHTENPDAEPEMKKLNSDDIRKLKIIRGAMNSKFFNVDIKTDSRIHGKGISDDEFLKKSDIALSRLEKGKYTSKKQYVRDAAYAVIGQMYRFGGNKAPISSKTGKQVSLWDYMKEKLDSGDFENSIKTSDDKYISPKSIVKMARNKSKIDSLSQTNIRESAEMFKGFSNDISAFIEGIKNTYGKGKSDSKPSDLMKDVLISMRRSLRNISNVSNEEFLMNLANIEKAADAYLEKRDFQEKDDRIERREQVLALKDAVRTYRGETRNIKAGKPANVHAPHLADKTEKNGVTAMDIKKNLVAFFRNSLEERYIGHTFLSENDPVFYDENQEHMEDEVKPQPPKGIIKDFCDALREWNNLGRNYPVDEKKNYSFNSYKQLMDRIYKLSSKYLAQNKGDEYTKDMVKAINKSVEIVKKNIRFLQPYMDLDTPEGKIGEKEVFYITATMGEPYNKLVGISDEMAIGTFGEQAFLAQKSVEKDLKKNKSLAQNKYHSGFKLKDDVTVKFTTSMYKNPVFNKLPDKKATKEELDNRKSAFSKLIAIDLFAKEVDKYDGWYDFSKEFDSDMTIKVLCNNVRKEIENTQSFKNVYKKVNVNNLGEAFIKEARKLGEYDMVKAIVNPEAVKKELKKMAAEKAKKSENKAVVKK